MISLRTAFVEDNGNLVYFCLNPADILSLMPKGREWWAPKDLPPQPGLMVRGEPPADAPAGRCPVCKKVFCVGCASAHLRESRFYCPDCGEHLKLSDDSLRWLLARRLGQEKPAPPTHGGPAGGPVGGST